MKKQAFNPFLPLNEYIPDGEPHVFGNRVYLFGSHDKENGDTYCMLDYVVYSAPIDDLSNWSCKGVSFSSKWDPTATKERSYLYAPDVVRGNDGRFYLYYCLSGQAGKGGYFGPMGVAVCDTPDGIYKYLGNVRNSDGSEFNRYVLFDPAVINDDGVIRLYYGTCYPFDNMKKAWNRFIFYKVESAMFGKTVADIKAYKDGVMGAVTVELEEDMLTVKGMPKKIIPSITKKTSFEGHGFFEGSSIRKVGEKYYFIYSSEKNHELCYATSKYPDREFSYGGTIISNGDVGYQGRAERDRLNMTGTTHGSIEKINGQWYVFFHRLTHKSDYSRQACAEPITVDEDGRIKQVEITSCGLNGGPLEGKGTYPAAICCNLTNGKMPHGSNKRQKSRIPYVGSADGKQFVRDISDKTYIGYKYFKFENMCKITISVRSMADGTLYLKDSMGGYPAGEVKVQRNHQWESLEIPLKQPWNGIHALYFYYEGEGTLELMDFTLEYA